MMGFPTSAATSLSDGNSTFYTLHRQEFVSNNIPDVIQGGKFALPDNSEAMKYRLCTYLTVYQHLRVD
jgi:hypothetical protein